MMIQSHQTRAAGRSTAVDRSAGPSAAWRMRLFLVLLLCWTAPLMADDAAESAAPGDLDSLLAGHKVVSESTLETERAKAMIEVEKIVVNDQDLNGTVSGNQPINTVTGHNTINGEAFSGAAGFVSSVQNTGNNVLIQNATIVNIAVEP